MNYLTVENLIDLQYLVNLDIELIDKEVLTSREVWRNTWCVGFVDSLIVSLKIEDLRSFVKELVEKRKEQVRELKHKKGAVFYMWYDDQSLHLCCSILSGKDRPLPFYCSEVVSLDSPDSILEVYLADAKKNGNCIPYEEVEFLGEGESFEGEVDYEDEEYTAYVYVERFD